MVKGEATASKNDADTKPTTQTILGRIDAQTKATRRGFAAVEKLFDKVAVRLGRIESEFKKTGSEFYKLRADFRELRNTLKEHVPAIR